MGDSKSPYDPYLSTPIPTYEDAIASSSTAHSRTGPSETSSDAERQGLLFSQPSQPSQPSTRHSRTGSRQVRDSGRYGNYRAATVESERGSEDGLVLPEVGGSEDEDAHEYGDGDEAEGLRRDMEQMEVLDPEMGDPRSRGRSKLASRVRARIESLRTSLSAISLPRWEVPWFSAWWDSMKRMAPDVPEEYRMKWTIFARMVGLALIVTFVYFIFALEVIPTAGGALGQQYNPESVRGYIQSHVDGGRIEGYLRKITSVDHVAGSAGDRYLADWFTGVMRELAFDKVEQQWHYVYLNYPKPNGRRVAIIEPKDMAWEAHLEEGPAYTYPQPGQQQTLVFHGLSRAGNVTGPLVYANYGSRDDFKALKDKGIDLKGTIALVRYYGTETDRGLKVKAAEEAGAAGCIIYSDPKEDGFLRGKPYPDGPWRPEDGVQRGTVGLTSWVVGDVLTPGWASTADAGTVSKDNNPGLVNIPSLPISWKDAQKLLQSLKGHGHQVDKDWVGGVPDVEWWSGDSKSPVVHLMNEQDENEKQPIVNIIGTIQGMEEGGERTVYVGNHRDSWCFGSVDPGSGTAVMLEVANIFSQLRKLGWRPLRTIKFMSWDAEEYNLIGSTEHVEGDIENIRTNGVAYLNVDVGVAGDKFRAAGSPLMERMLVHALDRVADPVKNVTLRSLWDEGNSKLEGLGAGSDYVAFQEMAGTASLDFGFEGPDFGFPYHSCYETFEWMTKFGDPGFLYHQALAQVWALLIFELADRPLIPFDVEVYAKAVKGYIDELERYASDAKGKLNLNSLRESSDLLARNAKEITSWEEFWTAAVFGQGGFESQGLGLQRLNHNRRVSGLDTDLLDIPHDKKDQEQHGIPGREQFKHILYGPQLWSSYDEATFPAVRDAIDAGDWAGAQRQADKAAAILKRASVRLLW